MTVRLVNDYSSQQTCRRWFNSIPSWEWVACDVETSGLDPWNEKLRLVQFGTQTDAWAIPFPAERQLLTDLFARQRQLVGWNSKFDEQFLLNNGFEPNFTDDARVMAHLLFSEQDLHLKSFADTHLGADSSTADKERAAAFRKGKWTWGTVPYDCYEWWYYGGMDTMLTARAAAYLYPQVVERGYDDHYQLELDVWHLITEAERRGICVDLEYCQEQQEKLEHDAAVIQSYYPDIPLGGRKKLTEHLLEAGVKLKKTEKGAPSIDEDSLKESGHPMADDILKWRSLMKNAHTYFAAFRRIAVDGRIHTTLKTMEARTGRMSSSIPNLQNVPKREAGAYVRRAFMSSPGCTFVFADFAQIEYRIFAAKCGEQKMIDAFLRGEDMHEVTARMTYGRDVTKHERDVGKNSNFTELYLGGLEKFADTAGITLDEAKRFKIMYHREFPRVKPYTKAFIRYIQANLFQFENIFGRRIGVDADKPYAGVNYDIQGTAADVMKRGVVRLGQTQWGKYLVLLVHDEYILDVPDALVDQCVKELPGILEDHASFSVPLLVDVSTAKRWGEPEEA